MLNRIREKLKNRKVRYVITAAAVVLLAVGVIFLTNALKQRTYSSFRVVLAEERIDSVSRCGYTPDGVVRYSLDGAALINQKLETVWSVTYAMSDPRIDVCGKQVLFGFQATAGKRDHEKGMLICERAGVGAMDIGCLLGEADAPTRSKMADLFSGTGYKLNWQPDMEAYLICHLAAVLPICYLAYACQEDLT